MKNKIRFILIVAISVMLLGLVLAGCGTKTPENPGPPDGTEAQVPETTVDPTAIAGVVTGDAVVWAHDVEEMLNAIDASGNSVVTLYQDISHSKALEVPYSCTVDFNGFTVTTNPQQGLGIQIREAGSENTTTTLKNGKLVSYSDSVRCKAGALVISDMQISTAYGNSVALYDVSEAYKDINRIENTVIVSAEGGCLSYSETGADFSDTGITLNSVDMVSCKADGAQVLTQMGADTVSGATVFEDKVNLYSYNQTACPNGMAFLGKLAVKETGATATAGEQTYTDMTLWTTESEKEVLDILMIGSSSCYYYVEELYAVADAAGYQLNVTNLYQGGCTIKKHWEYIENPADAKGKCQYFVSGSLGRYKHPTITTTPEALAFADWDVICVQQPWSVQGAADYETGMAACTPYAANMINYIRQQCPEAELYWHQNWAYAVGYQHPVNEDDDPTNDDPNKDMLDITVQNRVHSVIRQVALTVCEENNVKRVPSGEAWQLARAIVGDTLCKIDLCHDGDSQGGQYLNACVWFETLTGESCLGNTWRPTDYTLNEEKLLILQECAHNAVAAMRAEE